LIKPTSGGIITWSTLRRSRRRSSIAWSSGISLVGTSTSPSRRALGAASVGALVSLWKAVATEPQTSHVLRFQSGQGSQDSVLMVEILGGDNQ